MGKWRTRAYGTGLLLRLDVVLVLAGVDVGIGKLAHDEVLALGVWPVQGREVDAVRTRGDVVARGGAVHLDGGVVVAVVVRRTAQMGVDERAAFAEPLRRSRRDRCPGRTGSLRSLRPRGRRSRSRTQLLTSMPTERLASSRGCARAASMRRSSRRSPMRSRRARTSPMNSVSRGVFFSISDCRKKVRT